MKRVLSALLVLGFIFLYSCTKSSPDDNLTPLQKQYKSLTSDNVTSFFLDSAKAWRGCAGSNCSSVFDFYFKNLSNVSEISLSTYNRVENIWSRYQKETQYVRTYRQYSDNEYRLGFTLKDGRVLFSPWIKF